MRTDRRNVLRALAALPLTLVAIGCKRDAPATPDPEALKREAEEYRKAAQKERGIKP